MLMRLLTAHVLMMLAAAPSMYQTMHDQANWDDTRFGPPSPKWNGRAAALVPAACKSGQKIRGTAAELGHLVLE